MTITVVWNGKAKMFHAPNSYLLEHQQQWQNYYQQYGCDKPAGVHHFQIQIID